MRNGGAARKIMKRRRILIALRDVVIPSTAEGSFLALLSVSHRHGQGNDALVLRISAFAHPSFLGLQRRFLAFARNDDTRE